jgi:hypothetical protein
MKKTVSFEKKIDFPTMIGEVCAISLEDNLKFIDESNIEGNLELVGKYKLTEASRLEEDFNYKIPVEIALTEKLDLNTAKVGIADFYYEIENDDVMICHIELAVEGLEIIDVLDEDVGIDERECDGDSLIDKEIELPKIEKVEESLEEKETITNIDKDNDKDNDTEVITEEKEEVTLETVEDKGEDIITTEEDNQSLFFNTTLEDTYGTFLVYIVRQNETINTILEKYHTTIEEVEKYNDLTNLGIGTKLIIPILND